MRCFVAIELPDDALRRITALQRRHATLDRAVRWSRPEQMHLTLKFLGEVPDADVPRVCEAVATATAKHSPFPLAVRGCGCFPPGGSARILWVGIDEPTGALARLQTGCEQALADLGYPPEGRAFTAHVTVARVRDPRASREVRAAATAEAAFDAGEPSVREVVVFESRLAPAGAQYVAVARASLAAPQ